jgi:hypothetical protein
LSYQASHGYAFNPQSPSNTVITDSSVLAAVTAAWH